MKTYGDLNLIELRKKADIDFAHYTYKKGMCSCCYGPKDLPKMYWKDRVVQKNIDYDDIEYILFKNADNGSGIVRKSDYIECDNIEWNLPEDKVENVCRLLKEQLGDEYIVVIPRGHWECIKVISKKKLKEKYIRIKEMLVNPDIAFNHWFISDKSISEKKTELEKLKANSKSNLMQEFKNVLYEMYKGGI